MNAQQSGAGPQRVLIIDDHPLFRKGVVDLLSMDSSFQLVGEAANGEAGLELVQQLQPELVLLDLNMRGMGGVETLRRLRAEGGSQPKVLILTVSNAEEDIVRALRAGADGYLLKDMEPEEILSYLRSALSGGVAISPELTGILARALREDSVTVDPDHVCLTPREQQILDQLAAGQSNKLIARELDIAVGTVKVHVKNLMKKLGLKNRVEVALWASRLR